MSMETRCISASASVHCSAGIRKSWRRRPHRSSTPRCAVEWAKRLPIKGPGFKTEIRRVTTIDEFPQDNEWIKKERAWREATGQL